MANLFIWWRQRTPSEQRLLLRTRRAAGGVRPLVRAVAALASPRGAVAANHGERTGQPALDDAAGSAPAAAQPAARAGGKEALTALVMREAASHGLEVVRLQPQENVFRSPFSPAPFRR